MVNQGFIKGSKVEVRSIEEGFKGSCYVATIIEITRSNSCLVEYEHLMESEDKDSKHLRERVTVSNIRPLPPQNKNEIIKVHDIVDAYKRDGWWKGQVKDVFDDGKQFLVYFDDTPDELIVDKHDLRLHLDWVNGNWEKPSSEKIIEGSSGNKRTPSRKRGRQPKLLLEEHMGKENLMLATIDKELDDDQFMMSCQEYMRLSRARNISKVDDKRTIEEGASIGVKKLSFESLSGEDAEIQPCAPMDEEIVAKKVQKESLSNGHGEASKTVDIVSQNQDKSATSLDGDADVEKSSVVPMKDIIPYSPPPKNVQDTESAELHTPAVIRRDSTDNNTDIPFDKCSPLWKYIDSMEIYSKAKRKPHFSPLLEFEQETREGMAIAHIVTFSTLVEKTSKLQFSDSSSTMESYLQTLANLEKHGFDVDPVQSCLMLLLTNKKSKEKLEEQYKQIRNEITSNEREKDELDQAIFQMNQQIKELAKKLSVAESRKAKKNEELSALQSRQEVIVEKMRRLEDEVKKVMQVDF